MRLSGVTPLSGGELQAAIPPSTLEIVITAAEVTGSFAGSRAAIDRLKVTIGLNGRFTEAPRSGNVTAEFPPASISSMFSGTSMVVRKGRDSEGPNTTMKRSLDLGG